MAGACLTDQSGLTEFNGLTDVDLLARLIYSEARGESNTGKRGVYWIVMNRKSANKSYFGGSTTAGVILYPNSFEGMTTVYARCPDTSSQAWNDCLSIAQNGGSNPISNCLYFVPNWLYEQQVDHYDGDEYYTFPGGGPYFQKVITKVIIGNHTFFRVEGD